MTSPRFHVGRHAGRPCIFRDGQPVPFMAYSPVAGRRWNVFARQTARFFPHDFTFYFLTLPSAQVEPHDYQATPFWRGDDFSSDPMTPVLGATLDEMARHILAGAPNAQFIIRFGADVPRSWCELHPDELMLGEDGRRFDFPSLASEAYNLAAAKFSRAVVRHCQSHEWAERIAGYWNGLPSEGTPPLQIEHGLFDHSPAMQRRWREHLKSKYGEHAAPAPVPSDRLRAPVREVDAAGYWQAARENQPLRDYLELVSTLFQQHVCSLAGSMREAAGPDRILVYDMLKIPMQGWSNAGFFDERQPWLSAFPDTLAGSGHLGVSGIIDSAGLDGLITPHDYQWRDIGGTYEPEGPADSAVLRNKLFLCEMDTRTLHGQNPTAPARDAAEFAAITWRNLAATLTRGFHSYWMDVYEDWFADEAIHQTIARQADVVRQATDWPHIEVPGIAVILDDRCALETSGAGNFLHEAVQLELRCGLARCGVPVRIYQFDDLALDDFPNHRVFYFPNLFRCDEARLALLRAKVFRDNRVVVWGPGSGISDGTKIGPDSAGELTGFAFNWLPTGHPRRTLITNFDHPVTCDLPAGTVFGSALAFGPCLYPKDGISLGQAWTKMGRDRSGLAIKHIATKADGGWHSLFTTSLGLPANLWRSIARFVGAHVYCEEDEIVMASAGLIGLHSERPGTKRLRLPHPARVTDLVDGRLFDEKMAEIVFNFERAGTALFRTETT